MICKDYELIKEFYLSCEFAYQLDTDGTFRSPREWYPAFVERMRFSYFDGPPVFDSGPSEPTTFKTRTLYSLRDHRGATHLVSATELLWDILSAWADHGCHVLSLMRRGTWSLTVSSGDHDGRACKFNSATWPQLVRKAALSCVPDAWINSHS